MTNKELKLVVHNFKHGIISYKLECDGEEFYGDADTIKRVFDVELDRLDLDKRREKEIVIASVNYNDVVEEIQEYVAEKYEVEGYSGSDVSLAISLFDYSLIGKEKDGEVHFIYNYDDNKFITGSISILDIDIILNGNEFWFDLKGFLGYIGWDESVYKGNTDSVQKLVDMINFAGFENICGSIDQKLTLLDLTGIE